MKAQFIVTIEGNWLEGDKPVTASRVEKDVREAVRREFRYLANRVLVKRITASEAASATAHGEGK